MRFTTKWLVATAVALLAIGLASRAVYKEWRWKNFAEVTPRELYRSGQLTGRQLSRAIDRFQLKTVISFHPAEADRERAICREKGIELVELPMPADGLGRPEQFLEFLDIVADPSRQPILVHCSAGVARTGAAVALYRVDRQGWSLDQALEELKTFERKGRLEPKLAEHVGMIEREYLKPRGTGNAARTGGPKTNLR